MGRRYAMSLECLIFMIGVVVQVASTHTWQQFAVGRFIGGLGVGALSAAVPMVGIHASIHRTQHLISPFFIRSIKQKQLHHLSEGH